MDSGHADPFANRSRSLPSHPDSQKRNRTPAHRTADAVCSPGTRHPRCSRIAEECTAALEDRCGIQAYCLFTRDAPASADEQSPVRYVVMETCKSSATTPQDMYWVRACSLTSASLEDSEDFAVLTQCLRDLADDTGDSGFFATPGWLREVSIWVQSQATQLGLRLTGEFRQLNASPTFSLIRFATDGPALWFKSRG